MNPSNLELTNDQRSGQTGNDVASQNASCDHLTATLMLLSKKNETACRVYLNRLQVLSRNDLRLIFEVLNEARSQKLSDPLSWVYEQIAKRTQRVGA
jgi:hypothetical protein